MIYPIEFFLNTVPYFLFPPLLLPPVLPDPGASATNISEIAVNLDLVQFSNGVQFTFDNAAPYLGASVMVVRDVDAFVAPHGPEPLVVGQYQGNLYIKL